MKKYVHNLNIDETIQETHLNVFLECGKDAELVTDYEPQFSSEDIVKRAKKHIGKGDYDLPTRNCEHFASWCYRGHTESVQIAKYGDFFTRCAVLLGSATLIASTLGLFFSIGAKKSW